MGKGKERKVGKDRRHVMRHISGRLIPYCRCNDGSSLSNWICSNV